MIDPSQLPRRVRRPTQRAALRLAHLLSRGRNGLIRGALRIADSGDAAALTDWAYHRSPNYRTDWHQRAGLFDFEQAALTAYFPPAPASILVVGCGGGRELMVLAELGHQISGMDPVASLVRAAQTCLSPQTPLVTAPLAALEQAALLPGPFDAVMVGWGVWGHILRRDERIAGLRALRSRSNGPVLLSWAMEDARGLRGNARTAASAATSSVATPPQWPGWRDRAVLLPHMGCQVRIGRVDIEQEAAIAGFDVLHYGDAASGYPHAVLRPQT